MSEVFLSYSRDDQATARLFAEGFERAGLSVWWDQALSPGEAFDEVTENALLKAKAVVVLWSKKSVASRWVRAEATQAQDRKVLVPAMIESCKRPIMFELTHTTDLSHWKGDTTDPGWLSFLAGVRKMTGKGDGTSGAVLPIQPAALQTVHRPSRLPLGVAALAVILIGAGVYWFANRQPVGATQSSEVTLAVLPFVNLSSDPEQEHFSDGMTEEILSQLAQIRQLRVTGRTSSFSFKGKNQDLRLIADQLDVENLLEGSVRKDGGMLRINAQLINGKDGTHQWSKTYARELSDVFAMQEEIATDVAKALRVTLDVGDMSRSKGGTTNVEAYDKYMRGVKSGRSGDAEASILSYREAVALDPDFALAWYGIYRSLPLLVNRDPAREAEIMRERQPIRLRLESLLPPEGNLLRIYRAAEAMNERRWADAFADLQALQDLSPNDMEVLAYRTRFLRSLGRESEAIPLLQRLVQIEPLWYDLAVHLARVLRVAGRNNEADAQMKRAESLAFTSPVIREYNEIWLSWERLGAEPGTRQARLSTFAKTYPDHPLARIFAAVGPHQADQEAIRSELRRILLDPANQGDARLSALALAADLLGEPEIAVAALRRNFLGSNVGWLPDIWERTLYSGARREPAFKDLLRDLGIVDFYRASGNWGDICKPVGQDDFECE